MRILDLDQLLEGVPGISPVYGAFLVEAAAVCLTAMGHKKGATLKVEGDIEEYFKLQWSQKIGDVERETWADSREMVEFAATGLAILLILALTGFNRFSKKDQGDGDDYLAKKMAKEKEGYASPVEMASIEISGILKESSGNTVNMRINSKRKQLTRAGQQELTKIIVVLEFAAPKAKIIKQ